MNRIASWFFVVALSIAAPAAADDHLRALQTDAVRTGKADWGHWGPHGLKYSEWLSHSNRLIPVYAFGMELNDVANENSAYRDADRLRALYGEVPRGTLNEAAEYFDQTDIFRLQWLATQRGKKRIILFVFDGMDWWTSYAAAIHNTGAVAYRQGRGAGLHFQDYRGAATDFGQMVNSPYADGAKIDVNRQRVLQLGDVRGGYDWQLAGGTSWSIGRDPLYIIAKSKSRKHAYTDSAASATSMTTGIKTYNDAINVDPSGRQAYTIAHQLQSRGWAIGVVTSVPISHATPACAYSHNVHRDDYQDLTRDLLGQPSISHPAEPLPGVDVLLGAGWGERVKTDTAQGENFVPGNKYLTADDLQASDVENGGRYLVAQRTEGKDGGELLAHAADRSIERKLRLFGFFGVKGGHLPFRTADGGYDPTISMKDEERVGPVPIAAEEYSEADVFENPTLTDMATTALEVLSKKSDRFWLMIESGDVDWANHANNIDNSIGAVLSGDEAFHAITNWIENHGGWNDTVVILTADHGHYLVLDRPEMLLPASNRDQQR
ncbi:MAG: alkaline phosphatase [Pirellulales bacterium]